MLTRLKKRWLTPKMLGILLAKLILAGASDLAATTVPTPLNMQQPISVSCSTHLLRESTAAPGITIPDLSD